MSEVDCIARGAVGAFTHAVGAARRDQRRALARPPFKEILCADNGSRGSELAVSQAIGLARLGGTLRFIATSDANDALAQAAAAARRVGVVASTETLPDAPPSRLLLARSAKYDLLVIGSRGGARTGSALLGSTAAQVVHRAQRPTLVARRTVDGCQFPSSILLAVDGSPGSWAASQAAGRIAKARKCELHVVFVPDGQPERYTAFFKQLATLQQLSGAPAKVIEPRGDAATRIVEAARAKQSSLLVIGRRGRRNATSLGEVSKQVVHRSACSVLVVPTEAHSDDNGQPTEASR